MTDQAYRTVWALQQFMGFVNSYTIVNRMNTHTSHRPSEALCKFCLLLSGHTGPHVVQRPAQAQK